MKMKPIVHFLVITVLSLQFSIACMAQTEDIQISIIRVDEPIDCDDNLSWEIEVANLSGNTVEVVWVEVTMGAAFTFSSSAGDASFTMDNGTIDGQVVAWELSNLLLGSTATLTLNATSDHAPCSPDLDVTAKAWWANGIADGCSCTKPGVDVPDDWISLSESFVSDTRTETRQPYFNVSASLNSNIFTLTAINTDLVPANSVDIIISLPEGLTYKTGTSEAYLGPDESGTCTWIPDPSVSGSNLTFYDITSKGDNLFDLVEAAGGNDTFVFKVTLDGSSEGTIDYALYYYDCCGDNQYQTSSSLPALTVSFTNGANAALNFQQTPVTNPLPNSNWLCGQFSLNGVDTGATLNSVTVTLGGTYDSGDLFSTPFQLYASNTNNFATASALGSSTADPGSGNDVTFSGLGDAIPASTRYYWITADISANATGDDTIYGTIVAAEDLNISEGVITSSSSFGKLNAGTEASLPVNLAYFSSHTKGRAVILEWTTESETDNLGFILERSVDNQAWSILASYQTNEALKGQGNTSSRTEYAFTDETVQPEITYSYRLLDVSTDGTINVKSSLSITMDAWPKVTEMEKAYPNPFNPQTCIAYNLAKDSDVRISVYDIMGRKIRTLYVGKQQAGSYHVYWYGNNENGQKVASGSYIIRMQIGNRVLTQKVLFMK